MVWLYGLAASAASVLAMGRLVHWLQLESYQLPGYFRTLRRNSPRAWIPGLVLSAALLVLLLCSQVYASPALKALLLVPALGVGWQAGSLFQAPESIRLNLASPTHRIREALKRMEKVFGQ